MTIDPKVLDERGAFEDWARADNRDIAPEHHEEREPSNGCYYQTDGTNQAYVGWVARAALARQPQAGETAVGVLTVEGIEAFKALVNAAEGMSHGEDWNNGTHAKLYRNKLLAAIAPALRAIHAAQRGAGAADRAGWRAGAEAGIPDFGMHTVYHEGTPLVCRYVAPGVTFSDLEKAFYEAEKGFRPGDQYAGDPSKWPAARGILAVMHTLLTAIYGLASTDKPEARHDRT